MHEKNECTRICKCGSTTVVFIESQDLAIANTQTHYWAGVVE